jgi:hypothetical protein
MARRRAAKKFVETVFGKQKPTKDKANTEDFYNVEFDLKARGKTPAQREKLAKEMGFDKDSAKKVRTKDARGKLPKAPKSGTAKKKPSGPKADPQNVERLKSAAKKAEKSTPKSDGKPKRKYNMDAKQFEPNKPQAAGMVKRESPLKSKKAKLAEEFDGLAKGVKRAEQLKGRESKFYSVFKDRGMTEMKAGGYMKKKMAGGGSLKMSKGGGVSKAMGEDRTRVPAEYSAKAQSKKPVKKKMGGGKVYKRKMGGKVVSGNDGNSIVAACYD